MKVCMLCGKDVHPQTLQCTPLCEGNIRAYGKTLPSGDRPRNLVEASAAFHQQSSVEASRNLTGPHSHCDLCGKPLLPGARYRRVEIVVDAADSIVGGPPETVEHAYACCLCSDCAGTVIGGVLGKIDGEEPSDSDEVLLDFSAMAREILAQDPPVSAPAHESPEDEGCCQCGHKQTPAMGGVMTKVTWRCSQCRRLVCPNCALTKSSTGLMLEYYEDTLCSRGCWRAAGCPAN